ncbi:MAG TPA: malto-oligosyltrehalose trehalohydrolase [Candidatus Angelobacter sp.]
MKTQVPGKAVEGMLGATLAGDVCEFRVWAPSARRVTLRLMTAGVPDAPGFGALGQGDGVLDLAMPYTEDGQFALEAFARAGDRYFYIVDDHKPVPDPVSRLLPEGVHGPTEIVDPQAFVWCDQQWRGLPLKDYIIYELHIGTFTPEGTLDAAIAKLPYLKQLGITVIELMPVAAFPGTRNWGYDGVSPYAVQASYGGPEGLKRLVNAAHAAGLGVVLDVVYNHLGNEGNYLQLFGPYFTDKHKTPWGEAINYDQPGSAGVRRYVVENALYWVREYHVDGLRLDAVQTIRDDSPRHILAEIAERVQALVRELGREVCVIAETDENDPRIVRPRSAGAPGAPDLGGLGRGGYGLSAIWSDDFHHAFHAFFTGERAGYYQDFGRPEQIVRALNEGFVFQGEPFRYWDGRPRGASSRDVPAPAHVISIQNHDQVGNRALGERLSVLVPAGVRRLAAALLLLAPETPLIFMGEEYDETNPFLFFTDYGDPVLKEKVTQGRKDEFRGFEFGSIPDPQDPETFARSKLNWRLAQRENNMLGWYRSLSELRRKYVTNSVRSCSATLKEGVLRMQVPAEAPVVMVLARLSGAFGGLPGPESGWRIALQEQEDDGSFPVSVWVNIPK